MVRRRLVIPFAGRAALAAAVLALAACASRGPAPVEERRAAPSRTPPPVATAPTPVPPAATPAPRAPETDWRPPSYTVKRGDTLQAIALEHGLDYRELAAWNGIENANLIRVGQVLRLGAPGDAPSMGAEASGVQVAPLRSPAPVVESRSAPAPASASAPAPASPPPAIASNPSARNTDTLKVGPRAVKEPYSDRLAQEMAKAPVPDVQLARVEPARPPSSPPPVAPPPVAEKAAPSSSPPATKGGDNDDGEDLDWAWPAKGKLVTGFSDTANLKGIDIAGSAGQPVLASAPGRVVYAGAGLRGYGKLVIIKHNKTFLSAYAHNREIVVKEGQQVTRGQKIAEMGSTDTDQVKLHFEIRRLGKPMDPMRYLPPA